MDNSDILKAIFSVLEASGWRLRMANKKCRLASPSYWDLIRRSEHVPVVTYTLDNPLPNPIKIYTGVKTTSGGYILDGYMYRVRTDTNIVESIRQYSCGIRKGVSLCRINPHYYLIKYAGFGGEIAWGSVHESADGSLIIDIGIEVFDREMYPARSWYEV